MDDLEKQLLEATAATYFGLAFAEYVKAIDPVLWQRAREFAIDHCQKVHGVKLTLVDKENEE
jgi:hypothetical protein